MSFSKLNKFICKPIENDGRSLIRKPIILTSSKGFYLRNNLDILNDYGVNADIICKAGARFADYYPWLQRNLANKVKCHDKIVLYVWLGTCDLTVKTGKFINLRHHSNELANQYVTTHINKYIHFISQFESVKLVLVEIPPYSIVEWNRVKGHSNPEYFSEQDSVLRERIL